MKKPALEDLNSELEKLTEELDKQLTVSTSLLKKSLSIEEWDCAIDSIEDLLVEIEGPKFRKTEDRIAQAKELIARINELHQKLSAHTNFSDLVHAGGLLGLRERYTAKLLSLVQRAEDVGRQTRSPLSDQERATSVVNGLSLFQQAYKVHKAYQDIYTGLKYKKAEFTDLLNSKDIKGKILKKTHTALKAIRENKKPEEINPIKILSQRNLKTLKHSLGLELSARIESKTLEETAHNKWGLLPDEMDLFAALLNLPYKLQHGTNHFSNIARAGRLDSLTEIHRHRPGYESPFSTPGNLQELGNGGFIFMRCYVEGVNGDQTRYGNTRVIADLSLLREIGWVSLHDQLVPFSSANRQQTLYENKRLLFKATPADVNNAAKKNKSADGIQYTYRTAPIVSYETGTKDRQCSFGKEIATSTETIKFTQEIFYGPDILPGIALSIIYRLRKLQACGYRAGVLAAFHSASEVEKTALLGRMVKGFYRIEGKYPLGLPIEYDMATQSAFFKPVAGSDKNRNKRDRRLVIENPEGDGRYNMDSSVNTENAKQAYLLEKYAEAESKISVLQKQVARTGKPEEVQSLALYGRRKIELKGALDALSAETEGYLLKIAEVCAPEDLLWIKKRSYEFLKILAIHFVPLMQNRRIPVGDFKAMSLQKLALLAHETWIDLVADNAALWPCIVELSLNELEGMPQGSVALAMEKRAYTFGQLRTLFHEDKELYSYATCADLQELVAQHIPQIPEKLLEYITQSREDIDWRALMDDLDGTEGVLFEMNLKDYFQLQPTPRSSP